MTCVASLHWWTAFCLLTSTPLAASAETLTIISPHRKSIQDEFVPKFEAYYQNTYKTPIQVEWLDHGGTETNLKFLLTRFASQPHSANIDVFWGGGDATFMQMEQDGLLEPVFLSKDLMAEIPKEVAGLPLHSAQSTWHASALSSFGIFYNKKLIAQEKTITPTTWADLTDKSLVDQVSMADPRKSSSSLLMNMLVIQSLGWEKGWKVLTGMAGNTRKFTHSSSDPIKSVTAGETLTATAIDFYATEKVVSVGVENLGFVLPASATILNSDPIAMIKGAPNKKAAQIFIEFVLSKQAQKLFFMPKGSVHGPQTFSLGRLAVNTKAYQEAETLEGFQGMNPYKLPAPKFRIDMDTFAQTKHVFSDLMGAVHVDTHRGLKKAWKAILQRKSFDADWVALSKPLIQEEELKVFAKKWDDGVYRNQVIQEWVKTAQKRYEALLSQI